MAIIVETLCAEDLDLGVSSTTKTHAGGGTLNGTEISLSTLSIAGAAGYATTATWDPGSVAVGGSTSTSVSVPGAVVGDKVHVSHSSLGANDIMISGHVSAADTVRVVLFNPSAAAIDLASGTLSILVFHHR